MQRQLYQGETAYMSSKIDIVKRIKSDDIIDKDEVMERVGGDTELLAELIDLFSSDCPKMMSEMYEAIERNDRKALERIAHALKGSIGNFSANSAFEAALRLEKMGSQGDITLARDAYAVLKREIKRLEPALAALQKEGAQ
jgi:two-component system sensor histidine kinase/response regulator